MKFRNLSWLNTPVKIHKFYVLLLALCFYNIAFGQNQPVTVSVKNQPLLKVFESIEKQTKLSIAYNQTKLNVNQKVTVDFKNESTATVLNAVLKNTGLSYRTEGEHIIIIPQPASVTNGKQENSAPKKKIQGIITDTKGEALIGANVQVIGSQLATITDVNGNFSMEVPENGQLSVSYIGYQPIEISLKNKSTFHIQLKEDTQLMDEVVVIGFGTQKKVNMTGAVSAVNMKESLGDRPISNITAALQGVVPGLKIEAATGTPGEDMSYNIRGTTSINGGSPLVLVNNVPMDINMIDPQDIESVSILKDAASAAIYGARAAFGVILITTKQGKKDTRPQFNYNNNFSFSTALELPQKASPLESVLAYKKMGLPSDYCYYICESVEDHRLFILHGKGLSIFNREKGEVENTYHLFNQTYSQGSALYLDKNGTLFISGTNGLALFQKQSLYALPSKNLLNFDKLFIFNEEICPNDQSGILTDILAKTSDIYLSYKQNNITVEFASFNYNNDRNRLFEYRLEGFDKAWTQTTGTTITYTNLPPGEYILRARPLAGKENLDEEVHLNIHVSAPFYATVWAYFFYLLCLLGVMIAFIRFKTRQAALKSSLEFERKEKERIEELNQVKLRFFTNISHEFRTPLTLILGQIEVLMQMDLGTTIYNRILRIYKNAWYMRNLISELLDFRKQEQGYLKLKVEEQNLVTFTRQIYMCFYEYAQKKEITYRFDNVEETISVWFDSKQLQKVIFNLLSNAFKYTPNKGSIRVEVRMLASQAIVSVCDTGVGIPEEHISKIFERFYQTDNSSSFTLGTGIGLALAKGIMNMHHGKIDVESTVGKGTKFTLSLPLGNRHFSDEEMATVESRESVIISEAVPMLPFEQIMDVEEEKTKVQENIKEEDKPIILLVDDNEELLSMLEDLFLPIYKVYIAHDGREGLEMARQIQPDLIISDVMMPEMSGKELCYKIKTNVELSHISVVLLTAQTSVEYVVEGLMFGADDYVTKPFNVKVLIARCNNLIKNKKRLIAHYAGKTITESPVTEAINERDKELLAKCVNIIKENFENPAFDVTALASELCVGRSKLYMQFKQMTGLTPNEFILKIKLDEAMSLLKNHPELNSCVSQSTISHCG